METTATFRDYAFENLSGGTFSIDTSGDRATIALAHNHPEFAIAAEFDATGARHLGTALLRWTGGPSTCTLNPVVFETTNGTFFSVEVTDAIVEVTVVPASGGRPQTFEFSDDEVVDLAQRLIVFAGVASDTPAEV